MPLRTELVSDVQRDGTAGQWRPTQDTLEASAFDTAYELGQDPRYAEWKRLPANIREYFDVNAGVVNKAELGWFRARYGYKRPGEFVPSDFGGLSIRDEYQKLEIEKGRRAPRGTVAKTAEQLDAPVPESVRAFAALARGERPGRNTSAPSAPAPVFGSTMRDPNTVKLTPKVLAALRPDTRAAVRSVLRVKHLTTKNAPIVDTVIRDLRLASRGLSGPETMAITELQKQLRWALDPRPAVTPISEL